ncbi:MAG: tRNA (adenosine(37)-N6)-threonylcarbamoyltransferase complex dimerization subunit type 1 TsaB [Bacteroidota bacterium]
MILHLETSTQTCSVALSQTGKLLALEESNSEQYLHGEKLTIFIQKVLDSGGVLPQQIQAISISMGPGSYTGLRIGMATAKGLSLGLNIPIIGISSLHSLVSLGKKKHANATFIAAFEARNTEVFMRIETDKALLLEDQPIDLVDYSFHPNHKVVLLGNAQNKVFDFLGDPTAILEPNLLPSALGQVDLAWQRMLQGKVDDLNTLAPNYTKPCFIAQKKS